MSKRKHNIAYIKPNEPKFLRQMKEQIGYKEGPDVNTKVSSKIVYSSLSMVYIVVVKYFV